MTYRILGLSLGERGGAKNNNLPNVCKTLEMIGVGKESSTVSSLGIFNLQPIVFVRPFFFTGTNGDMP